MNDFNKQELLRHLAGDIADARARLERHRRGRDVYDRMVATDLDDINRYKRSMYTIDPEGEFSEK